MNVDTLFEKRNDLTISFNGPVRTLSYAAVALGLVALLIGFKVSTPNRVWGAFLYNLYFFFAIGLGASALGGMQDIVGALWGRPMRRVQEAFSAFVPVGCVMMVVFLGCVAFNVMGAADLYSWMKDPSILDHFWGKNIWLQKTPFILRNLLAVALIFVLWRWQIGQTTRRDKVFLAGDKSKALDLGRAARDRLRFWSAPILVVYAVCYTFMGFDMLMSLSPLWFSTLWGGWLFAVMMQTLLASLLITLFIIKKTTVGNYIKRLQFHDTGKLLHGFTIFFAYLTFAHVLTYWYGNVPEETEYFIHRLHAPWVYIVCIAPFFNFVIPLFAFLVKRFKWSPEAAIPLSSAILISQWFVYMLVVMPETGIEKFGFPWVELSGAVLFGGLFVLTFTRFAEKNIMLPAADPLLPDAYEEHQ